MDEQCYYRLSVKGIVIDKDGRIMLSRQDDGTWDLLGGGLDHEEDPIAGLKREIFEETGLRVLSVSASPKYFVTAPRSDVSLQTYLANVIYEITLENLDFVPSDECQELRFFSVTELAGADMLPNIEKLIKLL